MDTEKDIKNLEKKRDQAMTGFFWLGLQIAFIFGIPAFIAAFIGKKLSEGSGNKNIIIISLFISFILSWSIIIYIYRKKSKNMKKIEDEIRTLRKKV